MLAIRMQRTGRKGHAMFRVVVQDARRTPTSGKVVARLGSYDPHAKTVTLDKEKAAFYLEHGAQPSDRAAVLLQKEGVKLPKWVKLSADRKRDVRNPEKRRSTQPEEPVEEAPATETSDKDAADEPADKPTDTEPSDSAAEEPGEAESQGADAKESAEDKESASADESEGSEAEGKQTEKKSDKSDSDNK